jgi:hypothetical protein
MVNVLFVEERGQLSDEEILRVLVPRGIAYVREAGSAERRGDSSRTCATWHRIRAGSR